jgi:hypothetical protein
MALPLTLHPRGLVYDLSVLSNIPQAVSDLLPDEAPTQRLRPLFTIGVHDIPALVEGQARRAPDGATTSGDEGPGGWIACTTDSILAMKDTLWDVLVTMPQPHASNAASKVWPTVECPGGQPIKATQRDLRRYRALRTGLARLAAASAPSDSRESPISDSSANIRPSTSSTMAVMDEQSEEALEETAQPPSWAELAYGGFMWWASAGEQRHAYDHDEAVHDASLIADWAPAPGSPSTHPSRTRTDDSAPALSDRRRAFAQDEEARVELAIVAYFHRLTVDILTAIADTVDGDYNSYEDEESDTDSTEARLLPRGDASRKPRPIRVDGAALERMGLDAWSAADGEFVKMVADVYFGREAEIEGKGIEVCGLRVC